MIARRRPGKLQTHIRAHVIIPMVQRSSDEVLMMGSNDRERERERKADLDNGRMKTTGESEKVGKGEREQERRGEGTNGERQRGRRRLRKNGDTGKTVKVGSARQGRSV